MKNSCPECGARLAGDGPAEYCPACRWRDLTGDEPTREEPGAADAIFTVVGHDVLEEIARGGGGIVYRARQREPRREVALKMLLPQQTSSDEMHTRFRVETDAIAGLEHHAILPVYLVGDYRGMPFFTMKLATGGTLAARGAALRGSWRAIAELVATVADAVQFAHARGVIHRDLKPGNVLFDETGQPYVSDFGLAKFLEPDVRVTRTLGSFGTPAYLAPEIAERGSAAATILTDVYGLGAILYELLAGRPPFTGATLPVILRQIAELPPPSARSLDAAVPQDLDVIAQRCLAKDPAQRFASAAEFAADVRRWLAGRPIQSRPTGPAERLWRWARRNPALAAISTLFVASLITGGIVLVDRNVGLQRSTARATAAERTAREQLQASLISEARLTRRTGLIGQRATALALLDQAAAIAPLGQLRSEYIATLARSDLTVDRRIPGANARSDYTIDFSPDLSRFLEDDPTEGIVERDTTTHAVLRKFTTQPGQEVWYLSYGPDGRTVLASFRNGRTELREEAGATPAWSGEGLYGGDAQPLPIAIHPDGRSLVRVAADDSVRSIDRATGRESAALAAQGEVRLLSFNPAGNVLLVVHRDRATAWAWPEAKPLWTFGGRMSPARPAWGSDGRRVAVGLTGQDDIAILDAGTGGLERLFAVHVDDGRLLAFQPGGRLLASVGWDGRMVLLDALTGETLLQREAWVRTLRFTPDGRRLAFSSSHVEAVIATLATVDCLREMGEEPMTNRSSCRLAVSPDGRWVASTDFSELRLWDATNGRLLSRHVEPEKEWSVVTFAAEDNALIQSRRFSGLLRWPLVRSGETAVLGAPAVIGPHAPADLVRIHPASGDWWILRFPTGQLVRWPGGRFDGEHEVLKLPGLDGPALSPDARYLLRREYPKAGVQVLDATTAREVARLPVGQALSAHFSPDGQWVIASTSREYSMWKTGSWTAGPTWPAQLEGGAYGRSEHSPDGKLVAVLQKRGTLELRETKDYQVVMRLELPQDLWMNHFAWAPDGQRLYVLCLGHRVMYWDFVAIRRELAARGLDW